MLVDGSDDTNIIRDLCSVQHMKPSSRTPEGESNQCPICGKEVRIEPSRPPGDAPCPNCGHLLWFPSPNLPTKGSAESGQSTPQPQSVVVSCEESEQLEQAVKSLREKTATGEKVGSVSSGAAVSSKRWWQVWKN